MTWTWTVALLCGVAIALLLAPWGVGAPLRSPLAQAPENRSSGGRRSLRLPRRHDALADDLSAQRALEALARSVRAGRTLTQAVHEVSQRSARTPGGQLLLDTLLLASTAGTGPATVMERAAVVAADRVAARQERRAQAAQARLSATVLTWVPVGVATLAVAVDGDVRRVVLTTPLGWLCVLGGGGLSALGRRWIRRITEGGRP